MKSSYGDILIKEVDLIILESMRGLVLALLLTSLLFAKTITISVWASGSPVDTTRVTNVEDAAKLLNKMLEAAGSDIRIQVKGQFFRGDYFNKLLAAYAAGQAPDIIAMKNLAALAEAGIVIPLDKYIEKYSILLEDVYPSLWRSVTYKGHKWALPQDTEVRPLYYHKDILMKLWPKEKVEKLPELIREGKVTLMDLIKVAQEAMKRGLVKWGFYHRPNFGGTPFIILYYQYGGILQDPKTGKLVLVKDAMKKALNVLYEMAQVYKVLPPDMIGTSWRKIHSDFINGKVLFWFGGSWHWAEWQRVPYHAKLGAVPESWLWQHIGFALVPAPEPGLKPMTLSSPYLYYVTSESKHPELSFLLITIATSTPFDARHAVHSGHLPVRMTTVDHPLFKKDKFLHAIAYMLDYTSYEPIHPKWDVYKSVWQAAIVKVEKGYATPDKAVEQMALELKARLGNDIIIVNTPSELK